ncbi:MAG: HDOD domain-containing protein [Sutterellaceae bacterium]|nr:HDOD domain-containing protein [Burkholderiaceae bacterium]MDW8430606.1 HDOD domain-containing protein [Sutterellaceae bacterium]
MAAAHLPSWTDSEALQQHVMDAARAAGGLPSVGYTLARLTRVLESETEGVQELADTILADVALTQRLLRLANTLPYRQGTPPVTTVTRAIFLLGFDQVRAAATTLVLLDGFLARGHGMSVRAEFHRALLAGCLARELLAGADRQEVEEAAIAAMFRHLGRLLVAVFAPQALAENSTDLALASERLTERLLRDWSLPDRLRAAVALLPSRVAAPRNAAERIRVAAQFAEALAASLSAPCDREPAIAQVLARFAPAFALPRSQLQDIIEAAIRRAREFEMACGLMPQTPPRSPVLDALPQECEIAAPTVSPLAERDAIGRPANAREVLLAGLADAAESLARGGNFNTVIQVVLETIYAGLGFQRIALVLRDPATGHYRTRASFGTPRPAFLFTTDGARDLFAAALAKSTDLHIGNVDAEKIRKALPPWFARDCAHARSFVLLPLTLNGIAVGFLYADRALIDPDGLSAEELNLLRALRSQILLALQQRSAERPL